MCRHKNKSKTIFAAPGTSVWPLSCFHMDIWSCGHSFPETNVNDNEDAYGLWSLEFKGGNIWFDVLLQSEAGGDWRLST